MHLHELRSVISPLRVGFTTKLQRWEATSASLNDGKLRTVCYSAEVGKVSSNTANDYTTAR